MGYGTLYIKTFSTWGVKKFNVLCFQGSFFFENTYLHFKIAKFSTKKSLDFVDNFFKTLKN